MLFGRKLKRPQGDSYEDFSGNSVPEKGTNKMQTLSMEGVEEENMFMLEAFTFQKEQKWTYSWVNKGTVLGYELQEAADF